MIVLNGVNVARVAPPPKLLLTATSAGYDPETMREILEEIKNWNADPVNNPDPYSTSAGEILIMN